MNTTQRILITGIQGFLGKCLYRYLTEKGIYDIFGIDMVPDTLGLGSERYFQGDLASYLEGDRALIRRIRPEVVFHLAGIARGDEPLLFFEHNFFTGYHLCETLHSMQGASYDPLLIVLGTSAEYGAEARVSNVEDDRLLPLSHYGVSKALQTYMMLLYDRLRWMRAIIARPSNIIGPGQQCSFVVPDIAGKIVRMEQGKSENKLRIKNGYVIRDFIHVRDVAEALEFLKNKGKSGEIYNISSNSPVTIFALAEAFIPLARVRFTIEREELPLRPGAIPAQASDNSKLKNETGWEPKILLRQSLEEILEEERRVRLPDRDL